MSSISSSISINSNTNDYLQDNVFDKFDMKEYLSKTLYIPPCSEKDFLYKFDLKRINYLLSKNQSNQSNSINNNNNNNTKEDNSPSNNQQNKKAIMQINNNKFGIKLEDLTLKYDSGISMKFLDVYKPIKYIGHGSFGLVFSVMKIDSMSLYACKIIKKIYDGFNIINICNEVPILKNLDHPRILKLHEVIDTREYLYLFMDLIEGGTLKEFIMDRYIQSTTGKLDYFITDEESSIIMKGILEGINYMHRNSIMHRDLKPENIMFKHKNDLSSIIICDFGISDKYCNDNFSRDKCGTLIYMAPEMIRGRPSDQLIDVFAAGIILYILESGGEHPIYKDKMTKDKYVNELTNIKVWKFNDEFPNLARNIFLKLCKIEPFFRYQINKALRHPWIVRDVNCNQIPLTLVESYNKDFKVKKFKCLLTVSIYFNIFKSMNEFMFLQKKSEIKKKVTFVNSSPPPHKQEENVESISAFKLSKNDSNKNLLKISLKDKRKILNFNSSNNTINTNYCGSNNKSSKNVLKNSSILIKSILSNNGTNNNSNNNSNNNTNNSNSNANTNNTNNSNSNSNNNNCYYNSSINFKENPKDTLKSTLIKSKRLEPLSSSTSILDKNKYLLKGKHSSKNLLNMKTNNIGGNNNNNNNNNINQFQSSMGSFLHKLKRNSNKSCDYIRTKDSINVFESRNFTNNINIMDDKSKNNSSSNINNNNVNTNSSNNTNSNNNTNSSNNVGTIQTTKSSLVKSIKNSGPNIKIIKNKILQEEKHIKFSNTIRSKKGDFYSSSTYGSNKKSKSTKHSHNSKSETTTCNFDSQY